MRNRLLSIACALASSAESAACRPAPATLPAAVPGDPRRSLLAFTTGPAQVACRLSSGAPVRLIVEPSALGGVGAFPIRYPERPRGNHRRPALDAVRIALDFRPAVDQA